MTTIKKVLIFEANTLYRGNLTYTIDSIKGALANIKEPLYGHHHGESHKDIVEEHMAFMGHNFILEDDKVYCDITVLSCNENGERLLFIDKPVAFRPFISDSKHYTEGRLSEFNGTKDKTIEVREMKWFGMFCMDVEKFEDLFLHEKTDSYQVDINKW